jgi:hypothetical protein
MKVLVEVAGWIAALLILVAYALITTGKLQPRSVTYQALNVLGALGFIINSSWNGAIPSAALNVVWLGIGIVALARLRRSSAGRTDG